MEDNKKNFTVTSKKEIKTEKGDGTIEKKYKTVMSDGQTKVSIESVEPNELVNGETVTMTLSQNQKTLLEIKA